MKTSKAKHYSISDKAWQPLVGCSSSMPCAKRCWARRTVERVVACQEVANPKRAEFYQIALTPDGQQWSGEVVLDLEHLHDPLHWKKPATVATGFHGDWGRLSDEDRMRMILVMEKCPQHTFLPLTKQPAELARHFSYPRENGDPWPKNVSIGCSIMRQAEADRMWLGMLQLSAMGWRTHCWYEPALGPVNWDKWGFLEQIIMGGESGKDPRPCHLQWFRDTIKWCRANRTKAFVKQLGAYPVVQPSRQHHWDFGEAINRKARFSAINTQHPDTGPWRVHFDNRKGADPAEWPLVMRVQELAW